MITDKRTQHKSSTKKSKCQNFQCDLTEKILAGDVLNHSNIGIRMGTESRENQSRGLKGEMFFKKKGCKNQTNKANRINGQCVRFKTFNFNL